MLKPLKSLQRSTPTPFVLDPWSAADGSNHMHADLHDCSETERRAGKWSLYMVLILWKSFRLGADSRPRCAPSKSCATSSK